MVFVFTRPVMVHASPSTYKISIPNVQQEKTKWCWAASSVSCLTFSGITGVSQTAFVIYVKGSNVNQLATFTEVKSGLTHYGASWLYTSSGMSFSDIIVQMYTNKKPMMAGRFSGTVGHIVVVKGYTNTSSEQTVYYMNPSTGTEQYLPYSTFNSTWIETLYNIH